MSGSEDDLKFLSKEIDGLKRAKPHKALFHLEKKNIAVAITLDTSAYIRNRKETEESDKRHAALFVEIVYRAIRYNYQKTIADQLAAFMDFLKDNEKLPEQKYHYPLFEIYVRDPRIGGPNVD